MLGDIIESIINESIAKFDNSYNAESNFEKLTGLSELVDKLATINFKLYTLKNEVIRRSNDEKFRAWASEEDVKLCRARGLLKNCIDDKLQACILRAVHYFDDLSIRETKLYE